MCWQISVNSHACLVFAEAVEAGGYPEVAEKLAPEIMAFVFVRDLRNKFLLLDYGPALGDALEVIEVDDEDILPKIGKMLLVTGSAEAAPGTARDRRTGVKKAPALPQAAVWPGERRVRSGALLVAIGERASIIFFVIRICSTVATKHSRSQLKNVFGLLAVVIPPPDVLGHVLRFRGRMTSTKWKSAS